jgi:hypothetical protein
MASTAALTYSYRVGQGRIATAIGATGAEAFRDLIDGKDLDGSFARYLAAAYALVQEGHGQSSLLGAAYYQTHRRLSGVTGAGTTTLAPRLPLAQVTASLLTTGPIATKLGLRDGRTLEEALTVAASRTAGAMFRLTANGARDTVFASAQRDSSAARWRRVSDGDPCDFCAMLVGRGAVYFSEGTADSGGYHDRCNCSVEPVYS